MFEKYMIVAEQAKNITDGTGICGYQFGARLPYYRGLGLSMVEDIKVSVDGRNVEPEKIRFTVHDNIYTLKEMETEGEDRWEMGEIATITVEEKNGLPDGEHNLELLIILRISYMPFPSISKSDKKIVIS